MKRYLFLISHPAHFHMFKLTMKRLEDLGDEIIAVVRPKDVLENLCKESNLNFIKLDERPPRGGVMRLALTLFKRDVQIWKIAGKYKPDIMIGSDGSIARVGFLKGIPSFEMSEDDAKAIKLYALISYTFFTKIISPNVVDAWFWNKKKIGYEGYQKLAYLHPELFQPDYTIKSKYIQEEKYFILRFSALDAYHDFGIKGFTEELIFKLINLLEKHGRVYISSEKQLSEELAPYALNILASDLHHILAFSTMLIGDSQSMTVEAALLGVPSIRFSDLVGKLSVLEELENTYNLTFGFKPTESFEMIKKLDDLLVEENILKLWKEKRDKMLKDKINVTKFYTWFISNYPESIKLWNEKSEINSLF